MTVSLGNTSIFAREDKMTLNNRELESIAPHSTDNTCSNVIINVAQCAKMNMFSVQTTKLTFFLFILAVKRSRHNALSM